MSKLERPKPASRQAPTKAKRGTLAAAVGALPRPPKLAKPPSPRAHKAPPIAPPKPSAAKPRPPKPAKQASTTTTRVSVASRLGGFGAGRKPR